MWEDAKSSGPFVGGRGEKRSVRAKISTFAHRC